MKTFRVIFFLIFVILLNGCVQPTWHHNSKSTQQFYQDKINCRTIASRATPNISTSYRQPKRYSYSTQANAYGGYNGTIQPTNSGGGFLAGVAAADAGYPQRAYREAIMDCMRSKGWYLAK